MKRNFTKFLAALALLVFMMPSLVAWGQASVNTTLWEETWTGGTSGEKPSEYGFEGTTVYGGVSLTYSQDDDGTKLYNEKLAGGTAPELLLKQSNKTWTIANIPTGQASVMSLTFLSNKTTFAVTSTTEGIIISGSQKSWTISATSSVTSFNLTIKNTGSSNARIDNILLKVTTAGGGAANDPVISFDPSSINLGNNNLTGTLITKTFTVSQANLDDDISLSVNNGSLNIATIEQDAEPTTVTWTYTPAAAGTISAIVTATSGETTETLEISGTAVAPVSGYSIDFENEASLYSDWTFTTLTSKQTGNSNVTAHGGTYYGITGNGGTTGTATAAITTKTAVATPYTLTCFVTRQSDNTNSSTWYVQVSANGEDWTDVESTSATDMAKGVWKEISVDLSAYTDVYVRVYYGGSTAVRNIDDLTLSTDAPTVLAPTFSPVAGTYNEIQNVTITCATEGATIYYTTDGSTPNDESDEYTEAITVSETTTIKAIAYVGTESSAVATAEYVINLPSVATPTFTPAAGTYTGTQTVTIACETQGASILYKLTENGEWQAYTTALTISETTTVWAKATKTGLNDSEVATATYTIVTPITIAAVREQPTGDVVTTGIITYISGKNAYIQDATAAICVFVNTSNYWTNNSYAVGDEILVSGTLDTYGTGNLLEITSPTVTKLSTSNDLPYASKTIAEINEDNFSDLQCLHVKIENATVQSVSGSNNTIAQGENTILVYSSSMGVSEGDVITSFYANVGYYNGLQLVNPTDVQVQPNTNPSITVTPETLNLESGVSGGFLTVTYENLSDEPSIDVIFVDAAGQELETPYDWVNYTMEGTSIEIQVQANEGAARTAYLAVTGYDSNDILVQSNTVTINQAAYVAPITSGTGTITFGYGNVVINAASVTGTDNLNNTWTITTEGTTSFTNNNGSGFAQVGSSKSPAASITFTTTLPAAATISAFEAKFGGFGDTAGTITLMVDETTVGTGSLDGTNDVTVSTLPMVTGTVLTVTVTDIAKGVKCYYISYTLGTESYTLNITGYTDVTEGTNNKGYYLIASPVTVDPATVEGMTTGDFDLYYFDDSQDDEWINYKADDNGAINNFNLVPGKGYLYAKKATAETPSYSFNLTGAPYTGTGEIPVAAGWNLIGNPFGVEAEISSDYYALTYESNELIATTAATHVAAMQGVFVNADEDDTVIFEAVENNTPGKGQNIALNLSKATRGASTIDRAIVRFDEGQQLPKFQLFENSTKLYIPQGNKDFAIVRSAAEGEMPVNFRASENGTYTLSIETENVEMNYLHLIDNMTGADVDLLATPNYTFEARTNDYTSRFRLVFSAEENGTSTDSATFAYFNGTSWTVSNTGDATLQVVDITGRIVGSETINGNATVSLNQPAGIYMLRLVNGNDVKVQKVVVR